LTTTLSRYPETTARITPSIPDPNTAFDGNRDPELHFPNYFFFVEPFFVVFLLVPHFLPHAMSLAPPFT